MVIIILLLQAIRGVDMGEADPPEEPEMTISRRRVVQNLENSRRSMMNKRRTETLDAAFKKRFFALSSEAEAEAAKAAGAPGGTTPVLGSRRGRLTMRKGTIRALENRRNNVFGTLDGKEAKEGRGPSRRRLDRIFHNAKDGGGEPGDGERKEEEEAAISSDEDLKTLAPEPQAAQRLRKLIPVPSPCPFSLLVLGR